MQRENIIQRHRAIVATTNLDVLNGKLGVRLIRYSAAHKNAAREKNARVHAITKERLLKRRVLTPQHGVRNCSCGTNCHPQELLKFSQAFSNCVEQSSQFFAPSFLRRQPWGQVSQEKEQSQYDERANGKPLIKSGPSPIYRALLRGLSSNCEHIIAHAPANTRKNGFNHRRHVDVRYERVHFPCLCDRSIPLHSSCWTNQSGMVLAFNFHPCMAKSRASPPGVFQVIFR